MNDQRNYQSPASGYKPVHGGYPSVPPVTKEKAK